MTGEELEKRRSEGEQEGVVEKKRNQRKIRGGRASFIEVEMGRTKGVLGAPLRPEVVYHSRLMCMGLHANCVSTTGGCIGALGAPRGHPEIRKP